MRMVWLRNSIILSAAGMALIGLVGFCGFLMSGEAWWFDAFFRIPGTVLLAAINVAALVSSMAARSQFSRGEAMERAWTLISAAAACQLAASVCTHVVSSVEVNRFGIFLGGPVRIVVLGCALAAVLEIYRQAGLPPHLKILDWVLVLSVTVLTFREMRELALAVQQSKPLGVYHSFHWLNDPLLTLLLAEAVVVRRCVLQMGSGLIARCWGALTAGIFFTTLGDIWAWFCASGTLAAPLNGVTWYLWFFAGAAFALAPAYQVEAGRWAVRLNRLHPQAKFQMGTESKGSLPLADRV